MRRTARGFVLLAVLLVILLSSMTAVSLLFAIRAEATAQAATAQGEQAWAAVLSGIHRALSVAQASVQGSPDWEDNPGAFQHQQVSDDGANRWYFSIWTASDSDTSPIRFGLGDEAARLNIHTADPAWLALLPGWVPTEDSGESNRPTLLPAGAGAEASDPSATNAPPARSASVAAFLAESGLVAAALVGEDRNFNLRLDPNEDDGDESPPADDRDGRLDFGLSGFLTDLSYEPNTDPDGMTRINLNDPTSSVAALGLPAATDTYLDALRKAGQSLNHVADLLEARATFPGEGETTVELQSGVGGDELAVLLERCTATDQLLLPGLVNINTASAEVLAAVPGLDAALADTILATRSVLAAEERRTLAWVYTRRLLTAEQFREAAPHLTARSFQMRFHCVGYGLPAGRYRVVEVVIDVAESPARVVSIQDLTRHGFPLPLDLLETEAPQARLITRGLRPARLLAVNGAAANPR